MKYRILFGLLLSCLAFVATAAPAWQLNAGYFTPAKMPMTVVFPRPDTETNTWARNRIAYADGVMQYRIPISIQGGAYPFHFELTAGPSGMAVGQDYSDPNYGIITWTPTTQGGPYNVAVKVTDQEGKTVNVTWSVTADNTKFIFIDPKATTNGSGTIASPYNTMVGIGVLSTATSNPLYGKAVILRAGTTNFYGPDANGNGGTAQIYTLKSTDQNPAVFLGYTGEAAELDMSAGAFFNYGQSDAYFGQLTMKNARTSGIALNGETDTLMYFDWGRSKRTTFFENKFTNLQWFSGTGSSSNQAAIVFWNPGILRDYLTITGNTLDNFTVALFDIFCINYGVVENNQILTGSDAHNGPLNVKSDIQNLSIRRNTSFGQKLSSGLIRLANQSQTFSNDNIEVSYNTDIAVSGSHAMWAFLLCGSAPNIYIYRNTFNGYVDAHDCPGTLTIENNVLINNKVNFVTASWAKLTVNATDIANSLTGNLTGTTNDGLIDQYGALTGAASKYRGRIGHEISNGAPLLSAPTWR